MRKFATRTNLVSLTGGLGNQLFQYAVGLYTTDFDALFLTSAFGNPRQTQTSESDIYGFAEVASRAHMNRNSRVGEYRIAKLSVGFSLRSGFARRGIERFPGFGLLTNFITSLLTSFYLHEFRFAWASNTVGYDPRVSKRLSRRLLIGYFQTYRYASDPDVFSRLMSLKAPDVNGWYAHLQDRASKEKPIILHLRLTDYRNEGFGIPPKSYYLDAINRLRRTGILGSIWIFSDDPDSLAEFLPEEILKASEVMLEPPGTPPALVLQVMRLGAGYVIANSTFSWWAAFLRYDQDAPVCYPDPWFQSGPEIPDLCPPTWHRISTQVPNI